MVILGCLIILIAFFLDKLLIPVITFREYLATFKKTVAMHEVFLQRLAAHPVLRTDMNFEVFLEFDQDVSLDYDYMINIDITYQNL